MAPGGSATRDSYFTPSVTFCVRKRTARWARIADEARWLAISNDHSGPAQHFGLAVSRTRTGADDQQRSWAKLLGVDTHVATSTSATFCWLWAGTSSCVATVTITQQGTLSVVQIYQHAYNAEYDWPEHLGADGLRTFILDAIDDFDLHAAYSELPAHVLTSLENCVRSRTSSLIAEVGNIALDETPSTQRGNSLHSIWQLRAALRKIIAELHEQRPGSNAATEILTDAVSEVDTLLSVLNTQQLLQQTIADSRARDDQEQRDALEARRERSQRDREARHDRVLALFATVFIGPSLVFAFFSVPSSPKWQTHDLLLSAVAAVLWLSLIIWLLTGNKNEPADQEDIGDA